MAEHTILVAIDVDAPTREAAQKALLNALPTPDTRAWPQGGGHPARIEAWWIAEDNRVDGSDRDSAIFVPRGAQDDMRNVLNNWFEAHADLWNEEGYPYAETDTSGWHWNQSTRVEGEKVGAEPIDTSATFGHSFLVRVEYNTHADGSEVLEGDEPPITFHGPFVTQAEADAWIEAYPDGDKDIYDMGTVVVNNVRPTT